jgi:hypothetical protein
VKRAEREDPLLAVLAEPEERHLVATLARDMAVETVVGDVTARAHEPFGVRVAPLENPRPRREPIELAGHARPVGLEVGDARSIVTLEIPHPGSSEEFRGGSNRSSSRSSVSMRSVIALRSGVR